MIEFAYGVLCDRAIDDRLTNNMSLIEAFGRLTTTVPPHVVEQTFGLDFSFVLASMWMNSGDETLTGVLKTTVQPPKGSEVVLGEIPIAVGPVDTYKLRITINGIELRGPGWYRFILRLKEEGEERFKRVATIPLLVIYNVEEDALMIDMSDKQKRRDEEKD